MRQGGYLPELYEDARLEEYKISISIDRRYRVMYMSYTRLRHVTRIAAMRLGCI